MYERHIRIHSSKYKILIKKPCLKKWDFTIFFCFLSCKLTFGSQTFESNEFKKMIKNRKFYKNIDILSCKYKI